MLDRGVLPPLDCSQPAVVPVFGHIASLGLKPAINLAYCHLLALAGEEPEVLDAPVKSRRSRDSNSVG
jgi:hypothetical protein